MLLSWQVEDDGSLSGLVVHMWNIIIHFETTSIKSDNSLAHLMQCYICYISNKSHYIRIFINLQIYEQVSLKM